MRRQRFSQVQFRESYEARTRRVIAGEQSYQSRCLSTHNTAVVFASSWIVPDNAGVLLIGVLGTWNRSDVHDGPCKAFCILHPCRADINHLGQSLRFFSTIRRVKYALSFFNLRAQPDHVVFFLVALPSMFDQTNRDSIRGNIQDLNVNFSYDTKHKGDTSVYLSVILLSVEFHISIRH
jgi:hypothetical protein